MPYTVTLRLKGASAADVRRTWRVLAEGGFDHGSRTPANPPHVTLAIYPDDAPVARLREALQTGAAGWTVLPVTLAGLGVFPQPSPVFWAAPVATPALLDRQAAVQALLPDMPPQPHYRTGGRGCPMLRWRAARRR